jgi:O-succinylbenzoic acid--CoA ligase
MRIVALTVRDAHWTLDGRGAARGRTERAGIVVELRTSTGAVGRGEASPLPGMSRDTLDEVRTELSELSSATSAWPELGDVSAIFELATPTRAPAARFALEAALLDALAAERSTTIGQLLGAASQTLPIAEVVDDVDGAKQTTARSLKIKVGDESFEHDLERVRAIAAAAAGTTLRLDANRRWPRDDTRRRLAALVELPVEFVEEPCPDAHRLLDEALPLRIALDESLAELAPDAIFAALSSPSLGALILKPTLLGGFSPCLALAALARMSNKPAIVTHTLESPIGFAACVELARAIGGDHAHGLGPYLAGSATRVTPIVATPSHETVDAVHAALTARRPIALIHHALPTAEIERRRHAVEAAFDQRSAPEVAASDTYLSSAEVDAALGADRSTVKVAASVTHLSSAEVDAALDAGPFDDDAVVLFTSGSTAEARGVVLSRSALLAAAESSAAHLGWRHDDVWFVALSLAHAGGLAAVVRCWQANKPFVLLEGDWDRVKASTLLERCTLASLVPTQLAELLSDPTWRPPAELRAVLLGGAAASPALLAEAARRGVPFLTTYGMTESFGQLATAPLDRAGDPTAPLVPLPGVELFAGTRAAPAPIRVRAPVLAARYLDGEPIAPELVTSDLGFLEDGALVVVGRADDVIVTGGENVHPATVEAVVAATPGVRAACVFAIPDDKWGQIVGAAVATDDAIDATALAAWHAALPAHARPRELAIVRELPLLATGKLDRRAAARLPRMPVRYH